MLELKYFDYRYYELEERLGKLDPLAEVNMAPHTVCKVKVILDEKEEEIEVEVNVKQTIKDMKKLLQPFAGMASSRFRLMMSSYEGGYAQILNHIEKPLYSLNVSEECIFYVVPDNACKKV